MEKALGTNAGMDACLGFYDAYYEYYDIEAEPMAGSWKSIPHEATELPADAQTAFDKATEGQDEYIPVALLSRQIVSGTNYCILCQVKTGDAERSWARQKAVVNEYELDISGLLVHRFTRDSEWFDYIYHNRRAIDNITADVIIGPIANDTVFDTFGLISSGYLKVEDALNLLRIGPEYTQVAIKTQKAVKQLKWITSSIVEDVAEHQAALKDEKARYDALFSEEVNRIISSGKA